MEASYWPAAPRSGLCDELLLGESEVYYLDLFIPDIIKDKYFV